MVGPTSSPKDRGSFSLTTVTNTFAATARDDPTGLIGMGAGGMGASHHTTKVAWGGISGGHLQPHRNGGAREQCGVQQGL